MSGRRHAKKLKDQAGAYSRPTLTPGPVQQIDPVLLVRDQNDVVGAFFLSLALAYNDLKGLVVFELFLLNKGRPDGAQITPYRGEWFGMTVQVHRYVAGVIHEVMELIRKNLVGGPPIVDSTIQALLTDLGDPVRIDWGTLVSVASEQAGTGPGDGLRTALTKIRNQSSFHYYIKSNENALARAYLEYFGSQASAAPTNANQRAMYSFGASMPDVRFYYADAAAQHVMTEYGQDFSALASRADEGIVRLAERVNFAIASLLMAFVNSRAAEAK